MTLLTIVATTALSNNKNFAGFFSTNWLAQHREQ